MTLYLSASSIIDYLSCSKKFYYRSNKLETYIDTQEMVVGKIVHKIVEDHWQDQVQAAKTLKELSQEHNIDKKGFNKAESSLYTFYNCIPLVTATLRPTDLIEYRFEVPLEKDVVMVGKMDRVVKEYDLVYDWKTGSTRKKYMANDVQCNVYYTMYKRIFGREPTVKIVYLENGEIIQFYPKKEYSHELFNVLIPKMISQIKSKSFYKEGYFNGSCYRCNYLGACTKDL
jgi:hypothetical protein